MKPTIIISIPFVFSVRNVVRSGLYANLSERYRVVLAMPPDAKQQLTEEGVPEQDIFILDAEQESAWHGRAMQVLKSSHRKRCPNETHAVLQNWFHDKTSGRNRIRNAVVDVLGGLAAKERAFRWLERKEARLYEPLIPNRIWEFLKQTKPVFGLSTSCVVTWERPLFRAMHKAGIPIAAHVLSFDNLTSRGYLPINHFDAVFVWQRRMAEELKRFCGTPEDRITITGTPQFDFHVRDDLRLDRQSTAVKLGIESSRPYFVICANHRKFTPHEPELWQAVIRETRNDQRFSSHQWVVRPHPLDDYERWSVLSETLQDVVINHPWSRNERSSFCATPSAQELAFMGNLLRYADASLTIGSTSSLDSAVVNTPVVCVGFHPSSPRENEFYREAHYTHHYRPIMESGAAPLAESMEDLKDLLGDAINHRQRLSPQRAAIVADLCGQVDGRAGDRITDALLCVMEKKAHSEGMVGPTER